MDPTKIAVALVLMGTLYVIGTLVLRNAFGRGNPLGAWVLAIAAGMIAFGIYMCAVPR